MIRPSHRIPPLGPPKAGARQRVLAAWRGVDLSPLEIGQGRQTHSIRDLVAKVEKNARMDRRRYEAEIARAWNNLVDPVITAHAQPVGINKGTLFVNVDSSVWLDEIVRYRRKEILDRLQHSFGRELIARISFRVA